MKRAAVIAIVAAAGLMLGTWAWAQQSGTGQGMMGGQGPQGGPGMGSGMMGPHGSTGPGGGPMGQAPGRGMGHGPGNMRGEMGMGGRMGFAERPLISEMLFAREQLGLSPAQVEKLRGLRSGFEKDAIKKQAEIRVAEIDLSDLLAADPPDLGKIEPQVMKIATLRGNLRFARIKTLAEGRAVLSPEQWQKFQNLASSSRGPHGGRSQQGHMGPGPHGMMMGGSGDPREAQEGLRNPSGMMAGAEMGLMGHDDTDDTMGEIHEQFTSHGEQM